MSSNGAVGSSPRRGATCSSPASCVTSSRATWSLRGNASVSWPRSANRATNHSSHVSSRYPPRRNPMKYGSLFAFLAATLLLVPTAAFGQGGYGRGGMSQGRYGPPAPKLPGVELVGPLDTALARAMLNLSADQSTRYAQVYDSFMVATRPERDSANAAIAKMNEKLDAGDRAAALFYAERVQDLGQSLRDRQDRFEGDRRGFLNGDQGKAYKKWREGRDR